MPSSLTMFALATIYVLMMDKKPLLNIFTTTIVIVILSVCIIIDLGIVGILLGAYLLVLYQKNIRILYSVTNAFVNIPKTNKEEYIGKYMYNVFSKEFDLYTDFKLLPRNEPCIIVSNYAFDRIENIAYTLIPVKASIMIRDGIKYRFLGKGVLLDRTITTQSGCFEKLRDEIAQLLKKGISPFGFVSQYIHGNIFRPQYIGRIHTALFKIAKELHVKIAPIVIDHVDSSYGCIYHQSFNIVAGEPFFVGNVNECCSKTRNFFAKNLEQFYLQKRRYK